MGRGEVTYHTSVGLNRGLSKEYELTVNENGSDAGSQLTQQLLTKNARL